MPRIKKTPFRMTSVIFCGLTTIPGMALLLVITRIWDGGMMLAAPVFFISPLTGLFLGEYFYAGRYPWQKLETVLSALANLLPVRQFDPNGSMEARRDVRDDILYTAGGDEIRGFELEADTSNTYYRRYHMALREMLSRLPKGCSLQILKPSLPLESELLKRERPVLVAKRVRRGACYLMLRFDPSEGSRIALAEVFESAKALSKSRRAMSAKEISSLAEWIIAPRSPRTGRRSPFYPVSFLMGTRRAHAYTDGLCHAAASIACLPEMLTEEFSDVYQPIFACESVVSVTYEGLATDGLLEKGKQVTFAQNAEGDDARKYTESHEDKGNAASLRMQVTCLLFGETQNVDQSLAALETCFGFSGEQRPVFKRELGYLKDAILSCLPGGRLRLPFRGQRVVKSDEAAYYAPLPSLESEIHPQSLILRTAENMAYSLRLQEEFPVLIVGNMGTGKSIAVQLAADVWLSALKRGEPAAGFILDAGGSFSFLAEGVLESYIRLAKSSDPSREYDPIDIWPLAAFYSFGLEGVRYATTWVAEIMEISAKANPTDHQIIASSVEESASSGRVRLYELLALVEERFKARLEVLQGEVIREQIMSAVARLRAISKGSRLGAYFDPDEVRLKDMNDVSFLYCVKTEADKSDPEALRAWSKMCFALRNLLLSRYESGGTQPRPYLTLMDEFEYWRVPLGHSVVKDILHQERKRGARFVAASQDLSHFILDDEKLARQFDMLRAFKRIFLYAPQSRALLAEMLTLDDRKPQDAATLHRIERILETVVYRRTQLAEFSGCYITENKASQRLLVDATREDLWLGTTKAGGRVVRRAVFHYLSSAGGTVVKPTPEGRRAAYLQACRLLAERFDGDIPDSAELSNAYLRQIIKDVFRVSEVADEHILGG